MGKRRRVVCSDMHRMKEREREKRRGREREKEGCCARERTLFVLVHRAEDLHGSTNASLSLMYTYKTMYESPGVNRTCT